MKSIIKSVKQTNLNTIIITKSGKLNRKESNAFKKMEGAVRDKGIKITYSGRMHRRNP